MQEDEWEAFQVWDKDKNFSEFLEKKTASITLELKGEIVSIMGVLPLPQAGGHLWLFMSEEVKGSDLLYVTKCVEGAIEGLKEVGYEWFQTPVRNDFKEGKRWARMLGFRETDQEEDIMDNGTMYTYWTRGI